MNFIEVIIQKEKSSFQHSLIDFFCRVFPLSSPVRATFMPFSQPFPLNSPLNASRLGLWLTSHDLSRITRNKFFFVQNGKSVKKCALNTALIA
jgi:hypothetical protein